MCCVVACAPKAETNIHLINLSQGTLRRPIIAGQWLPALRRAALQQEGLQDDTIKVGASKPFRDWNEFCLAG